MNCGANVFELGVLFRFALERCTLIDVEGGSVLRGEKDWVLEWVTPLLL